MKGIECKKVIKSAQCSHCQFESLPLCLPRNKYIKTLSASCSLCLEPCLSLAPCLAWCVAVAQLLHGRGLSFRQKQWNILAYCSHPQHSKVSLFKTPMLNKAKVTSYNKEGKLYGKLRNYTSNSLHSKTRKRNRSCYVSLCVPSLF